MLPRQAKSLVQYDPTSAYAETIREGWVHWKGQWHSSVAPDFVRGTISIPLKPYMEMKMNARNGSTFDTTAYVAYKGLYRFGTNSKLPVTVKLHLNEGEGDRYESDGKTQQFIVMQFKATIMGTQQVIQYQTTSFNPYEIKGTYVTHNPGDQGEFVINPSADPIQEEVEPCTIL